MDIYNIINDEIFSDPFYASFNIPDKKLVAWYLLNIKELSEEDTVSCIFTDGSQNYVDAIYVNEDIGTVYIIKALYIENNHRINFSQFKKSVHFFEYLVKPVEFNLTGDRKLNRAYFYLQDCIERKYRIVFEFLTTTSLDEVGEAEFYKVKSVLLAAYPSNSSVELIGNKSLSEKYDNGEDLEKDKAQDAVLVKNIVNLGTFIQEEDIPDDDKEAIDTLFKLCKAKWCDENPVGFDDSLLALKDYAVYHHIYAVFQCFCIISEINDNRIPSPKKVLDRLTRDAFLDNVIMLGGKCVRDAYEKVKSGQSDNTRDARDWIKNMNSLNSIRTAVDEYFKFLAFMTRGTRELLASYNEEFLFPEKYFTLHIKPDLKYDEFFGNF